MNLPLKSPIFTNIVIMVSIRSRFSAYFIDYYITDCLTVPWALEWPSWRQRITSFLPMASRRKRILRGNLLRPKRYLIRFSHRIDTLCRRYTMVLHLTVCAASLTRRLGDGPYATCIWLSNHTIYHRARISIANLWQKTLVGHLDATHSDVERRHANGCR